MFYCEDCVDEIVEKCNEYLKHPSVVGHETSFLNYLAEDYEALDVDIVRGKKILQVSGKSPQSLMLSVHIDRHGLISVGDGDYRYAGFVIKNTKYNADIGASEKLLNDIKNAYLHQKVYAYNRYTGEMRGEGIIEACERIEGFHGPNLVFRIPEMEEMPFGTPIAYKHDNVIEDDYISGQIDNTLCVALIYGLFKNGFEGTCFFTAEEEIGKSWKHFIRHIYAHDIKIENFVVLDSSPYPELAKDANYVTLRNRDQTGAFDPDQTEELRLICKDLAIPYDFKDKTLEAQGATYVGQTELGHILRENNGFFSGTTLQVPTHNYHTNKEATTHQCLHNVFRVIMALSNKKKALSS